MTHDLSTTDSPAEESDYAQYKGRTGCHDEGRMEEKPENKTFSLATDSRIQRGDVPVRGEIPRKPLECYGR